MRTKEEGIVVLLTLALAWNPVNVKPSCSLCRLRSYAKSI